MTNRADSLEVWLQRLEQQHPVAIDLGLDRVGAVARELEVYRLPTPVITVAGTNGKGSVVASLEALATATGLRVGAYTSPHLLHFNERIRIDRVPLSDAAIAGLFERVEAARGETSLTYFEFTTLAALLAFAEAGLDLVVLEVGLGGRLDAVNIIDPDVAVITSIGLDHLDWLGDSLAQIAREKAGIARPGRACVLAEPALEHLLGEHLSTMGAIALLAGRDYQVRRVGERLQMEIANQQYDVAAPVVRASNAAAAVAAFAELFPEQAEPEKIDAALADIHLAGRYQRIAEQPEIIVDVAHNGPSLAALAERLEAESGTGRTFAICGMFSDKATPESLQPLLGCIDAWCALDLPGPRGASAGSLTAILEKIGVQKTEQAASMDAALETCLAAMDDKDRLLVFGSFVTVALCLQSRGVKKL